MNFLVPNPWRSTTIEQAVASYHPGLLGAITSTRLFIDHDRTAKTIRVATYPHLPAVDFSASPRGWLVVTAATPAELVEKLTRISPAVCDLDIPAAPLPSTSMYVVRLASDLVTSGGSAPRRAPPVFEPAASAPSHEFPCGADEFPCESTYFPNPFRHTPLTDIMTTIWELYSTNPAIQPATLLGVWCPASQAFYRPVKISNEIGGEIGGEAGAGAPSFKQVATVLTVPPAFATESWFVFCGNPDEAAEAACAVYGCFKEIPLRPIDYTMAHINGEHIYYPTSNWLYNI